MLLVNLFGSPSAGKSTISALVFAKLKLSGVNCELVTEFAKDKVWEESVEVFKNQLYIAGKQNFRVTRCKDKVDVIITDSPLLLSSYYNNDPVLGYKFDDLILDIHNSYESINYFLIRDKPYNQIGRFQTEEESDEVSKELYTFLNKNGVDFEVLKGNEEAANIICLQVLSQLELEEKF